VEFFCASSETSLFARIEQHADFFCASSEIDLFRGIRHQTTCEYKALAFVRRRIQLAPQPRPQQPRLKQLPRTTDRRSLSHHEFDSAAALPRHNRSTAGSSLPTPPEWSEQGLALILLFIDSVRRPFSTAAETATVGIDHLWHRARGRRKWIRAQRRRAGTASGTA